MEPYDSNEFQKCMRCSCTKEISNFINSRKVIGKYCRDCLAKRRKYNNSTRCEHDRVKTNCKWCKNETDAEVKPLRAKKKISELSIDEDGNVILTHEKLSVEERLQNELDKKEKLIEKLRMELEKNEREVEELKKKLSNK
jgi:hypothetical protein